MTYVYRAPMVVTALSKYPNEEVLSTVLLKFDESLKNWTITTNDEQIKEREDNMEKAAGQITVSREGFVSWLNGGLKVPVNAKITDVLYFNETERFLIEYEIEV